MEVFDTEEKTDVRKTIEDIKGGSHHLITILIIIGIVITGIIAAANKGISNIPVLGSLIFWSITTLFALVSHSRIEKRFEKMKSSLGVESDEEMDDLLNDFTKLGGALFISDRCFVNLNTQRVCLFSEIKAISTSHFRRIRNGRAHHMYTLNIHMKDGKCNNIGFSNSEKRDRIYNMIISTAAFTEGSGYAGILSDADND